VFAYIILAGGTIGLGILLVIAAGVAYWSKIVHRRHLEHLADTMSVQEEQDIMKRCTAHITTTLTDINDIFSKTVAGLAIEDRRSLHDQMVRVNNLNAEMKVLKDHLNTTIREMNDLSLDNGHYYVQVMDYLRETAHCMTYITNPSYEHINNNHKGLHPMQVQELAVISSKLKLMTDSIVEIVAEKEFDRIDETVKIQQELIEMTNKARKTQIKRIKNEETKTRNSMLYFGIIHESKSIALHSVNTLKAYRDFVLLS
jgi:Na+/phosphate symporter